MKSIFSFLLVTAIALSTVMAKDPGYLTDLDEAITQATDENKAIFVMYGRDACGNCSALKNLLAKKEVRLPKTAFVIVDLNCDDPATSKAFRNRYTVQGNTLPFVVIAKPDGTQVSSRTGYGSAAEYKEFIRKARKDLP